MRGDIIRQASKVSRVDIANNAIVPRIHHEEFSIECEFTFIFITEDILHSQCFYFNFGMYRRSNELINLLLHNVPHLKMTIMNRSMQ